MGIGGIVAISKLTNVAMAVAPTPEIASIIWIRIKLSLPPVNTTW